MTRRERLEAKLERRREWAEKAAARSSQRWDAGGRILAPIPLGQPILVGHHSEKRHRRAVDRAAANFDKAVEEGKLAAHHASRAGGLEHQLETAIFSDDPDAVEALEAKVAKLEAERTQMKAANAHWRRHKTMRGFPGLSEEAAARLDAEIPQRHSWDRQPFASYSLTNLGARIRDAKQRIGAVGVQQGRAAAAEAAPGGVVVEDLGREFLAVTFAEKPARSVLDALRAAGFRWSQGRWVGHAPVPAVVQELVSA